MIYLSLNNTIDQPNHLIVYFTVRYRETFTEVLSYIQNETWPKKTREDEEVGHPFKELYA